MGALLMGLLTIAAWSFANGIVSETFLYGTVSADLAYTSAGDAGLDAVIAKSSLVARVPQAAVRARLTTRAGGLGRHPRTHGWQHHNGGPRGPPSLFACQARRDRWP